MSALGLLKAVIKINCLLECNHTTSQALSKLIFIPNIPHSLLVIFNYGCEKTHTSLALRDIKILVISRSIECKSWCSGWLAQARSMWIHRQASGMSNFPSDIKSPMWIITELILAWKKKSLKIPDSTKRLGKYIDYKVVVDNRLVKKITLILKLQM